MLQTQGLLHDTYVYGIDARSFRTIIHPNETMDGAIVLVSNCVSACDKNSG